MENNIIDKSPGGETASCETRESLLNKKRGFVTAQAMEDYIWLLRGDKDSKIDKIVDAAGIYSSKVNMYNIAKYFCPMPELIDENLLGCTSINNFITEYIKSYGLLFWDDEYKDLMHVITW